MHVVQSFPHPHLNFHIGRMSPAHPLPGGVPERKCARTQRCADSAPGPSLSVTFRPSPRRDSFICTKAWGTKVPQPSQGCFSKPVMLSSSTGASVTSPNPWKGASPLDFGPWTIQSMFQEVRWFQSTGKPLVSELFAQSQGGATPISQSLTGEPLAGAGGGA